MSRVYDVACVECGEVFKENVSMWAAYRFMDSKSLQVAFDPPTWATSSVNDATIFVETPCRDARGLCDHTDIAELR